MDQTTWSVVGHVRDRFGVGGRRNKALRIPQLREEAGHKESITTLFRVVLHCRRGECVALKAYDGGGDCQASLRA